MAGDVNERLVEWIRAGIVDAQTADRIRTFEQQRAGSARMRWPLLVALAFGADAVLLIVRCLSPAQLARLLQAAAERGLAVLTEVHAPEEVPVALDAGAQIIGVNARDLDTLQLDAARAQRVLAELPAHVIRVHLSGIKDEAQVSECARSPIDAALMGEVLMRLDDPEPLLRRLAQAARLSA